MASYILATDITDTITTGFTTSIAALILRSDDECNNYARELGLETTDIETPVDYNIKQWLIAWVTFMFCQEFAGKTGLDIPDQERYYFKWKMYQKRECELRAKITKEMFEDTVYSEMDAAPITGLLYRS